MTEAIDLDTSSTVDSEHTSHETVDIDKSKGENLLFQTVVRYPRSALVTIVVIQLIFWVLTICLAVTGHDVLPIKLDTLPLSNPESVWYKRRVAAVSADLNIGIPKLTNENWIENEHDSLISYVRLDLLYKTNGNILTADKLTAVKQFEEKLVAFKELHKFFYRISLFQFAPPEISYNNKVASLLLKNGLQNKTLSSFIDYILPSNFTWNKDLDYSISPMLRTILIPRSYGSKEYNAFLYGPLLTFLKEHGKNGSIGSDITFAYWSMPLYGREITEQVMKDSLLLIGSVIVIIVVLLLHTGSIAVTFAGLFGILSAIVLANLIYRYMIGHKYIGILHAISVFVLLGIGADDVFVLFDAWTDSFQYHKKSETNRLAWVIRRAGIATLITSLTTAIAFLVNMNCSVPLVSTFGCFTGIAVLCNYIIAITFIPCVLLNLHNACGESQSALCALNWKRDTPRRMARFFENIVLPFFRLRGVSIICLVICAVLACIFIWQTTLLVPTSSMLIQMFSGNTNYERAEKLESYMATYGPSQVSILFGAGLTDMSECDKDSFTCLGTPRWSLDLDMSQPKTQIALLKFCRRLRTDPIWKEKLNLASDPKNPKQSMIRCIVDDFERETALPKVQHCPSKWTTTPLDLRIPLDRRKIEKLVACYPQYLVGGRTKLSQNFSRFYEAGLSVWLLGKTPLSRYGNNRVKMTFEGGDPDLFSVSGRIRMIVITASTNLGMTVGSFRRGKEIRSNWETIIGREISRMPTVALRRGFQCTAYQPEMFVINFWEWFEIQEALWNNSIIGVFTGIFGVALPILFLATRNIVLTLAGTVCLTFAIGGVIMVVNCSGWSIGVTESINLAVTTGVSVDYVVHFIEAYHQASNENRGRGERVQKMLIHVGGAVSSGLITTLGAIAFLLGSKLITFKQFALFLGSSIFFAFFSAIFLLTPFLLLFGPEGQFGSLDPVFVIARKKLKRKS